SQRVLDCAKTGGVRIDEENVFEVSGHARRAWHELRALRLDLFRCNLVRHPPWLRPCRSPRHTDAVTSAQPIQYRSQFRVLSIADFHTSKPSSRASRFSGEG